VRLALSLLVLVAACVSGACRDGDTVLVRRLVFRGVRAIDEGRLRAALATRGSSALPWGERYEYNRARLDADLKRIEAFYADRGYPDARVTGLDVRSKGNAVEVVISIAEGEPIRLVGVTFTGFDVVPPDRFAEITARVPMRVGQPRDRQDVVATHELAVNALRDHGYPYATVATEEDSGPDGKSATVAFVAAPGTLARFGGVEIVGNVSVTDSVIRRQLSFVPGETYSRRAVQETVRRLYALELFLFVNVEALDPERQDAEVRTRVTVAEGRHQRVNLGVGYGTEEKARVDAEYRHVNFLGGARTGGAHARWSSLDRGLRLDVNQPYFFTPHLSLGGDAERWYTYTPAYRSIVSGGTATLRHRSSASSSWAVSISSERNRSTIAPDVLDDPELYADLIALGLDPTTGSQEGTLNAVGFEWRRSTADSLLDARRGYQVSVQAEAAGGVLPGSFNYTSVSIEGRHYVPIGDRLVVANRAQLGTINAAGDDPAEVPFSRKYFLGGATSLRGWGRYEVGPLGGSGLPIGGNALLAFTAELRFSLAGSLGGVLFVDGGNVWGEDWTFRLGDLRYDVGSGLRYRTPVGPVRVDAGWQLTPVEGLVVRGGPERRRWRLHFSIGQTF
jgi:outer membrane protein assembly complex protein YaeT